MTPLNVHPSILGRPRVHAREIDSTNLRGRQLAGRGAPHGTLVTADAQTAGRGRQGRGWSAPPGASLLCSLVIRPPRPLLSLAAGVAVADVCTEALGSSSEVAVKWPNDVLVDGRKVAGILVEGRPADAWAVLGIGLNVAVDLATLPDKVARRAASLGLTPSDRERTLAALLAALDRRLRASDAEVLDAIRARDALLGRPVRWAAGEGVGAGIDTAGRLLVSTDEGTVALDAGEVHLGRDENCDNPGAGPRVGEETGAIRT